MKRLFSLTCLILIVFVSHAQTNKSKVGTNKSQTAVRKSASKVGKGQVPKSTPRKKSAANFCPDDKHPHAIDLGLPSETLWACCNVGANIPEELGGSYAVGEVKEKKIYSQDTYKFAGSGSESYTFVLNIIGGECDVAHVKWGKEWQMPTVLQYQELIDNCIFEYTKIDSVGGAKMIGPNGNVIFMPGAGFSGGRNMGSGYYVPGNSERAMVIQGYWPRVVFYDSGIRFDLTSGHRDMGHSVRPVKDER